MVSRSKVSPSKFEKEIVLNQRVGLCPRHLSVTNHFIVSFLFHVRAFSKIFVRYYLWVILRRKFSIRYQDLNQTLTACYE